jgi:hypothetical protein
MLPFAIDISPMEPLSTPGFTPFFTAFTFEFLPLPVIRIRFWQGQGIELGRINGGNDL